MSEKKTLSATAKKVIKIAVTLVVILGILSGGLIYLNVNQEKVSSKLIIACMPKTITGNDNGRDIDFYVEYNKNYDPDKDEPIKAFLAYYYDGKGEKVELPGGRYESATADMQVVVGFFFKAQQNIKILKNVITVIISLVILCGIALLIYIWYKSWCKREEKKKDFYLRDFDKSEQ